MVDDGGEASNSDQIQRTNTTEKDTRNRLKVWKVTCKKWNTLGSLITRGFRISERCLIFF